MDIKFDLRALRCFVAVAEDLHFGRAARRLNISQPPLSQTIRALETRLGVLLLERTRRRVALTHAGGVLLERARLLLDDALQAGIAAQRASRGEVGRLTVSFILAATHRVLPQTLREFRRRMPEVSLTLREMSIPEQLKALASGEVDIGILRPPVESGVIASACLVRERFVAALPEEHRLARHATFPLARLAGESFVLPSPGRSPLHSQIISMCASAGFAPAVVQDAENLTTLIGLVRAGLGVALLPQSIEVLRPAGVEWRGLRGESQRVETAIAWRRDDRSPVCKAFLDAAHAACVRPASGGPGRAATRETS
jgi:DNA-binding transcriptional LysR family regulator